MFNCFSSEVQITDQLSYPKLPWCISFSSVRFSKTFLQILLERTGYKVY